MYVLLIMIFTILNINIRGITSKGSEIQNYILNLSEMPHIICFQETLLNDDKEFHLLDYSLINRNRSHNKGGGCAIYVHKNVRYTIINISERYEYIKIHVEYQNFQCTILNYYNPCAHITLDILNEFIDHSYKNLIIFGILIATIPFGVAIKYIVMVKMLKNL